MSGRPLTLTPPADLSKVYLPLAIGIALTLVIYAITRSTLPYVGDSTHALPHGGFYKDGTKTIHYHGIGRNFRTSAGLLPLLLAFSLPLIIYVSSLPFLRSSTRSCPHCSQQHPH
ncbi:triple gene block protein 2 [Papaya virus X]|uniref:Triple gene block protein 2 n=1 Tax=Papaya virus X TaxID=2717302 RepID=A0A858GJ36_9VIRU|nr:triple gene block protein 2 [Papaya virus X]